MIEKTAVATEVEKVLSDLYPLLRAVQPGKINMTLNAIATALEGRGDQLGENLETVDAYLKRLNPQIPALVEDLRLTAQVSDIYADVLPEVGTILQNTVTTTGTARGPLGPAATRCSPTSRNFSDSARTFLDDNESNLIRLGEVSAAQLRVLSRYSTEFPCLLKGIVKAGDLQAEAFRGFTLHIVLETLPNQPRAYDPQDVPRLRRGPRPVLHQPAQPARVAGQPGAPPARLQRRRRRADRQGHLRAPATRLRPASTPASSGSPATPAARPRPTCSATCSRPGLGV